MPESEAFDDLGTLYGGFYDEKRKTGSAPEPGQIVFCPALETDRRLKIGDVQRSDPTSHRSVTMRIREQERLDFKGKDDRLPIHGLKLGSTHELVISRAKLRPCLVIGGGGSLDPKSLPDGSQQRLAAAAFYPSYFLAPTYSVSTAVEPSAFVPVVTARVKCLMYPEFFYLRQSGGYLRVPSIARLDRLFVSAPHPGSGFEPTDLFLIPEIFSVVVEQVRSLFGQALSTEYRELREMMLSFLPAEAATKS